jgi:hypothetical protein
LSGGRWLGLLTDRWGQGWIGQVVLLAERRRQVRLVGAEILARRSYRLLECAVRRTGTALWPFADLFGRLFQWDRSTAPAEKPAQPQANLAKYGLASPENLYHGVALSCAVAEDEARAGASQRKGTHAGAAAAAPGSGGRRPVLFVVEIFTGST